MLQLELVVFFLLYWPIKWHLRFSEFCSHLPSTLSQIFKALLFSMCLTSLNSQTLFNILLVSHILLIPTSFFFQFIYGLHRILVFFSLQNFSFKKMACRVSSPGQALLLTILWPLDESFILFGLWFLSIEMTVQEQWHREFSSLLSLIS